MWEEGLVGFGERFWYEMKVGKIYLGLKGKGFREIEVWSSVLERWKDINFKRKVGGILGFVDLISG